LPKILVVLPIHNEERTLADILRRVAPHCDGMILVNDASTDGCRAILDRFSKGKREVYRIDLQRNRGMAGALEEGFLKVLELARKGRVGPDDLVVTLDADGQHKPEYIPRLVAHLRAKRADVALTRRDFSLYPLYKVLGNRFLTFTNSILSGMEYRDVESGMRALKVRTLPTILRYYTGMKYSCAQEIALISARSGFRIDNDFQVEIAYYRPGTTLLDGFIVLGMSLLAFLRWRFRWTAKDPVNVPWEGSSMVRGKGRAHRGT